MNHHAFGYHPAVIPDDAAGRPLSPTELATIADLEQRLLDAPAPARVRGSRRRGDARGAGRRTSCRWPRSSVAGVVLVVVAVLAGGLLGAAAVLVSVVVTAFAWPLLPSAARRPAAAPPPAARFIRLARPR